MLPACIGLIPFGLVCGVGAAAAGVDFLGSLGMSAIIFSGAAQILAVQLYADGRADRRHRAHLLRRRAALPDVQRRDGAVLETAAARWQNGLAFLLTDQAFAASIRRFSATHDPRGGALHFLGGGSALWIMWQVTNAIGFLAGNVIPASWSLEFAVPLCFIALLAPRAARRADGRRRGRRRRRSCWRSPRCRCGST